MPDLATSLATVLALRSDDVEPQPGVRVIAMTEDDDVPGAARTLEVFLDRVVWAATLARGGHGYLLEERYRDLRDDADADSVQRLAALAEGPRTSAAWKSVAELLHQFTSPEVRPGGGAELMRNRATPSVRHRERAPSRRAHPAARSTNLVWSPRLAG